MGMSNRILTEMMNTTGDILSESEPIQDYRENRRRGQDPKKYVPFLKPLYEFPTPSPSPRHNPDSLFSDDYQPEPNRLYTNCILCGWFRTAEEIDDERGKALVKFIDELLTDPVGDIRYAAENAADWYLNEIYNKVDPQTREKIPYMTAEHFLIHIRDHTKINAKVFLKTQLYNFISLNERLFDKIFYLQGGEDTQVDHRSIEMIMKVNDKIMQIYKTKPDEMLYSEVTPNEVQKAGRLIKDASNINEVMKGVWGNGFN